MPLSEIWAAGVGVESDISDGRKGGRVETLGRRWQGREMPIGAVMKVGVIGGAGDEWEGCGRRAWLRALKRDRERGMAQLHRSRWDEDDHRRRPIVIMMMHDAGNEKSPRSGRTCGSSRYHASDAKELQCKFITEFQN